MRPWILGLIAAMTLSCVSTRLQAETAAELLEKGIYNEETVGNLDEAIKLYRGVISSASETKRIAANAQFRLAMCLFKQEKTSEATEAFKTLVEKYPEQKELVCDR